MTIFSAAEAPAAQAAMEHAARMAAILGFLNMILPVPSDLIVLGRQATRHSTPFLSGHSPQAPDRSQYFRAIGWTQGQRTGRLPPVKNRTAEPS